MMIATENRGCPVACQQTLGNVFRTLEAVAVTAGAIGFVATTVFFVAGPARPAQLTAPEEWIMPALVTVLLLGAAVKLVVWLLRGWTLPLGADRIQRATVAVTAWAGLLAIAAAMVVVDTFRPDTFITMIASYTLGFVIGGISWGIYRLTFLALLRGFEIPDDRAFELRMARARLFVAGMLSMPAAALMIAVAEHAGDLSTPVLWAVTLGGPALCILGYLAIMRTVAWRIRRKLEAAQPAEAAASNGN